MNYVSRPFIYALLLLLSMALIGSRQVAYAATHPPLNPENALLPISENFTSFTGAGFSPTPAAGQLDSDNWIMTGMSDAGFTFGGTVTTGDYARGTSTGGVTTGGAYAFNVGSGNMILGVQPGGTDFTPGDIILRLQNNTGSVITDLDVSYTIWYLNDQARGNSLNFAHSPDNSSYTSVSALDFATPAAADALGWQSVSRTTTLSGLSIANGASFYLRWQGDDVNGSGNRDEYGIDDVQVTVSAGGGDTPPTVSSTSPANGATGVAVDTAVSVTFSEAVTFSNTAAYVCDGTSGNFNVTPTGGPATWTITPPSDLAAGESCTITITAADITDQDGTADPMAANYSWSFTTAGGGVGCGATASAIYAIQGNGSASPFVGSSRTIEGIVVGDFQGATALNGFFVQEETADTDADPTTSDGIYVYAPSAIDVNIGDLVRLTGTVAEYFELTELNNLTSLTICSSGNPVPAPTVLTLPFATAVAGVPYLERLEGMSVTLPAGLTVTNIYALGRGSELELTSGDTLDQPTQVTTPGANAIARQASNDLNRILLDDTNETENPPTVLHPAPALSATNRVRNGDQLAANLSGVLTYGWSGWSGSTNEYRVRTTTGATFTSLNPRPAAPASVGSGADVYVASFNVLNYFNGNGSGGGFPTARGANTLAEFNRQRDKIIQAIVTLNADVIGLMEIENDGYTANSAIADLVNGLNAVAGPGTYAFINPGGTGIGSDQIAVGLLYKPARVTPVGSAAILDNSFNPLYQDTLNRPALAQTFQDATYSERFTVVVNHLKSKGSACSGDPDTGDGQGNCNLTRQQAAQVEVAWLATDPTSSGDPDFLIIGDLNSYALEDPITAFKNGGFVNLGDGFGSGYSYTFDGQFGHLDHALAAATLTAQVSGATVWHINADEPPAFDYNDYNQPALYVDDAYRASDHDPVLIGIDFQQTTDFSDLSSSYGVAWHIGNGAVRLGSAWTNDTNYAASNDNGSDDGVLIGAGSGPAGQWQDGVNGGSLDVTITGTGSGCLYAWIDWNNDGVFSPTGAEYIIQSATTGSGNYAFDVPAGTFQVPPGSSTPPQNYSLRVRLYGACASGPTGAGFGGEVEDYVVGFSPTAVSLHTLTAQANRPTLSLLAAGLTLAAGLFLVWSRRK